MSNGDIKKARIEVLWDHGRQKVGLKFDTADFVTWDFIIAILEMAKMEAESQRKIAQMVAMQRQIDMAQQDEALRRKIGH
jgi:hypothetical protein